MQANEYQLEALKLIQRFSDDPDIDHTSLFWLLTLVEQMAQTCLREFRRTNPILSAKFVDLANNCIGNTAEIADDSHPKSLMANSSAIRRSGITSVSFCRTT